MYQLLVAAGGLRSAGLSRSSHTTTATREMGDGQTDGVHIIHDGNCRTNADARKFSTNTNFYLA